MKTLAHSRGHTLLNATDHTDVATYLNQALLKTSDVQFDDLVLTGGLTVGGNMSLAPNHVITLGSVDNSGYGEIDIYASTSGHGLKILDEWGSTYGYFDKTGIVTSGALTAGGYVPHYDSGWFLINAGNNSVLTHNLGALNTLVYMEVSASSNGNNAFIPAPPSNHGWSTKTTTQITVYNSTLSNLYFRIAMFKLA